MDYTAYFIRYLIEEVEHEVKPYVSASDVPEPLTAVRLLAILKEVQKRFEDDFGD
jgi:hypothetical protein